jgi:hypothetical protein
MDADFAAKGVEVDQSVPFYRAKWLLWVALSLVVASLLGLGATLWLARRARDARITEIASQRRCLQTFLSSNEFKQFSRTADAELVALYNFIAVRPETAQAALPDLSGVESRLHLLPWAKEVEPMPVSAAGEPEKILAEQLAIDHLFSQRDYRFDPATEHAARMLFLRVLAPQVKAFQHRAPENGFDALAVDRSLQDLALTTFAARHGAGADVQTALHMFSLYARIGPAMWAAIDRDLELQKRSALDRFKP